MNPITGIELAPEIVYVHKQDITPEDFLVGKGAINQKRKSHKKLYKHRDGVFVSDNYPSLNNIDKRICRRKVSTKFSESGGRWLRQVDGNKDLYYIVSELEVEKLMLQKFRQPRPHAKAALEARLLQEKQELANQGAVTVSVPVVPKTNKKNDINHAVVNVAVANGIYLNLRIVDDEGPNGEVGVATVPVKGGTDVNHLDGFIFLEHPSDLEHIYERYN